jgi:hypothetical protein
MRIGFGTKRDCGTAENLGLGLELCMCLKTDNDFPLHNFSFDYLVYCCPQPPDIFLGWRWRR